MEAVQTASADSRRVPVTDTGPYIARRVLAVLVLAAWLLAGCASNAYTPVVDRDTSRKSRVVSQPKGFDAIPASREHVVQRGETLYSIAWRYGLDVPALARANGIGASYTIYPQQRLTLNVAPRQTASSSASSAPVPPRPTAPTVSAPAPARPVSPVITSAPAAGRWQWPHDGSIIGRFSNSALGNKGVLIAGKQGDPVKAAADGVVVYRGSGMTGYGNLLIIKHDDQWLSAYAHNDRMLVSEGATVKAGQTIAAMGDTGTSRTQLHFEIRRNGTPVDPLTLLPGR